MHSLKKITEFPSYFCSFLPWHLPAFSPASIPKKSNFSPIKIKNTSLLTRSIATFLSISPEIIPQSTLFIKKYFGLNNPKNSLYLFIIAATTFYSSTIAIDSFNNALSSIFETLDSTSPDTTLIYQSFYAFISILSINTLIYAINSFFCYFLHYQIVHSLDSDIASQWFSENSVPYYHFATFLKNSNLTTPPATTIQYIVSHIPSFSQNLILSTESRFRTLFTFYTALHQLSHISSYIYFFGIPIPLMPLIACLYAYLINKLSSFAVKCQKSFLKLFSATKVKLSRFSESIHANSKKLAPSAPEAFFSEFIHSSLRPIKTNAPYAALSKATLDAITSFHSQFSFIIGLQPNIQNIISGSIKRSDIYCIGNLIPHICEFFSWETSNITSITSTQEFLKAYNQCFLYIKQINNLLTTHQKITTSALPHNSPNSLILSNLTLSIPQNSNSLSNPSTDTPLNLQSVLQNTSIQIPKGATVFFNAPSGSGKSTLFLALTKSWPFTQCTTQSTGPIILNPQEIFLLPDESLLTNILFPNLVPQEFQSELLPLIIQNLNSLKFSPNYIQNLKNNTQHSFSGGERQKIALLRSLAYLDYLFISNNPTSPHYATLLLDEPTASIDPNGRKAFNELLLQYKTQYNLTLIYTSHHVSDPSLPKSSDPELPYTHTLSINNQSLILKENPIKEKK